MVQAKKATQVTRLGFLLRILQTKKPAVAPTFADVYSLFLAFWMSLTISTIGIIKTEKPKQISHWGKFKLAKWKIDATAGINAISKIAAMLTNKEMTKVLFLNGFDVKMEWLVRTLKI